MDQLGLFGSTAPPVSLMPVAPELQQIAEHLPRNIRLGTSSWTFPGWAGQLWRGSPSEEVLARHGLAAYAQHPLLRTVGVDRTFYKPVEQHVFADWHDQVPDDFRFLVKAHEHLTTARFPKHPRYGPLKNQLNPRFLDADYAIEAVVRPTLDGLRDKLGVLLFQFPPHDPRDLAESPRAFAIRLYRFLTALPSEGRYAVEVRNDWCLVPDYAAALREAGASHGFVVHSSMPTLDAQRALVGPGGPQRVVRWMLRPELSYSEAVALYGPFTELVAPDIPTRDAITRLLDEVDEEACMIIVNNKAEGCSPASVQALARRLSR